MELHGSNILGADVSKSGAATFRTCDPASGRELGTVFHEATDAETARALEIAEEAYASYRSKSPAEIANFLDAIAAALEELGDALIARAHVETRLPKPGCFPSVAVLRASYECSRPWSGKAHG